MAGYITHGQEKSVVLSVSQVDALVAGGSGDAALLYLLLQRLDGPVTAETLAARLNWSQLRLSAAETALQDMGFLRRSQQPPAPSEEHRVYSGAELADLLEADSGFRMLVSQTEEKLGKKLKTADLQILAGLYDDLGLPVDVIYLLVCHCVERAQRRFGEGRRPTLRQIRTAPGDISRTTPASRKRPPPTCRCCNCTAVRRWRANSGTFWTGSTWAFRRRRWRWPMTRRCSIRRN